MMEQIIKAATELTHDWIILSALQDDDSPDLDTYMDTIRKIKHIEETYNEDEIKQGHLLCDIW